MADQDVEAALEAAHWEYNQGILENKPAHILAFYQKWTACDFEERDNPKGHVTKREEMLSLIEQVVESGGLGGFSAVLKATSTVTELILDGDRAAVAVTNNYRYRQADAHGWYGIIGEEHEIETKGHWRETWVRVNEDWQLQLSQLLSNQTYVDGVMHAPEQME